MSLEEKDLHRDIFKKATLIHIDRFQRLLKGFFHKRSLTLPFLLGEGLSLSSRGLGLEFSRRQRFFSRQRKDTSLFFIYGELRYLLVHGYEIFQFSEERFPLAAGRSQPAPWR